MSSCPPENGEGGMYIYIYIYVYLYVHVYVYREIDKELDIEGRSKEDWLPVALHIKVQV